MDITHLLSSQMVVYSLDVKNTYFVIVKLVKNYLIFKYYIFVSFVHLCTCLYITFSINLLAMYSPFQPKYIFYNMSHSVIFSSRNFN